MIAGAEELLGKQSRSMGRQGSSPGPPGQQGDPERVKPFKVRGLRVLGSLVWPIMAEIDQQSYFHLGCIQVVQ